MRASRAAALGLLAAALGLASPAECPTAGDAGGTLLLPGLAQPVRVLTDRWGIPHIRARSLPDLYFAWGFVTARDRLWQMLAARQAVRGQTWRWLGNRHLQADGGAQLFELDALAGRIWERARRDPAAAVPIERYCAGVNAWLDLCRRGGRQWPVEVERLRLQPDDWAPHDVVGTLMGMGALLNLSYFPQLAERAEIARHGAAWLERRHRFDEQWMYDTIPDSAARRLYGPAGSASSSPLGRAAPAAPVSPRLLAEARRVLGARSLAERDLDPGASNAFAAGPARSASGRPLLANDPHLALQAPGELHLVHVCVPGVMDAAGACVPGLPTIVSGRSAACAWGITSLDADVADIYADSLSRDGKRVRWRGGWVPVVERPFDLAYRVAGIPVPVGPLGRVRRYTPHGPVLVEDRKAGVALSLRWAGASDSVDLAALLRLGRARTAAEVCAIFRALATPCLNVVAADRDGHVRYQVAGRVPMRGFVPPRGPLPGDGRWEWRGIIPPDRLPAWDVPPRGFVVNSNNRPVGPPYFEPLVDFAYPQDRALRIAERLGGDRSLTPADMASVQNDVLSRLARRTLPLLLACADSLPDSLDARMRAAVDTLRRWDYVARRTRLAPTLWRGWYGAFLRRSDLEGLPGLAYAALQSRAPDALRAPGRGGPERPAVAAVAALRMGLDELARLLGPDVSRWRYGLAHRARFRHDLGRELRVSGWEGPAIPVDGDAGTPCVGSSRLPWNAWVTHGPVLRQVTDLAVAESSLVVLPPGNSGDLRGPHARDLAVRWAMHGYVPLYLSWERAEAARGSATMLAPAPRRR